MWDEMVLGMMCDFTNVQKVTVEMLVNVDVVLS